MYSTTLLALIEKDHHYTPGRVVGASNSAVTDERLLNWQPIQHKVCYPRLVLAVI